MSDAVKKRIQQTRDLQQEINKLNNFIPKKWYGHDGYQRQFALINQRITTLVEAAIDEGMEAAKEMYELDNETT